MTTAKKPASKNKNRAANQAAIALIAEHYPEVFNRDNVRPLKIGIQEDLVADGKLSRSKIKRALASYVRAPAYYKSLQTGADRIDLQGEAAGQVTEAEAEHAKAMLKKIRDARNERVKQEREQQKQQRVERKEARFNDKLNQLLQKGRPSA